MKQLLITGLLLLSCLTGFTQSGWYTVPGAPVSWWALRFDDVYFINDSTGFIAQDGDIYKTSDKGDNWNLISSLPNVMYIRSLEFINDTVGFIGTLTNPPDIAGLFKTVNGGYSFTRIDSLVQGTIDGICGMAHYGNIVIGVGVYSEPGKFYKSIDAGNTWTVTPVNLSSALVDCYMLNDSTYLIGGMADNLNSNKGIILKTTDGGQTWQTVALSTQTVTYCWKIFISPDGKGVASLEEGTMGFITSDFGSTWNEIFVGNWTLSQSAFGGTAFINDTLGWIGNQWNEGLFETQNGGSTWTHSTFGQNIDRMVVLDSNTVLAVGLTVYKYSASSTGIAVPYVARPNHQLNVSPNPAKNNIAVSINLIHGTNVTLDIFSDAGLRIKNITKGAYTKGEYFFNASLNDIPAGNYFVWLRTNEEHIMKKFDVIK